MGGSRKPVWAQGTRRCRRDFGDGPGGVAKPSPQRNPWRNLEPAQAAEPARR